jgi:competence protein ComFC
LNKFSQLLTAGLDFVLPQTCIVCGKEIHNSMICDNCLDYIPVINSPFCQICGRPIKKRKKICRFCKKGKHIDRGRAWVPFIPPVDTIIHNFKYLKKTKLAIMLGRGMAGVIRSDFLLKKTDVIVPVPLFWWKKLRRGYNQSGLLADVISKECSIKINPILKRIRNTKTQTRLHENVRKENVFNAFALENNGIKDKTVLLVDDVLTTGATIDECARILKNAGTKAVYSCVAAITPG